MLKRKAQTSLEVMFIFAIILSGTLFIVKSYYSSDTSVSITYQARATLSDACSYLNTGVVVEDSLHSDLNKVIEANNYTSLNCAIRGIRVYMNSSQIKVVASVMYSGNVDPTLVENAMAEYLVRRLSQVSGYSFRGGVLYFGETPVDIEVRVK